MMTHQPIVGKSEPFKLKSIRKERPPAGAEGIDWHRYVITQGDNTIVGHRQGSTSSVTLAVEEIVVQLNLRRLRYQGRVHPTPSPSIKKPDLSRANKDR